MKLMLAGLESIVATDLIRRALQTPAITSLFVDQHQLQYSPQIVAPSIDITNPFDLSNTHSEPIPSPPPDLSKIRSFHCKHLEKWAKVENLVRELSSVDACIWVDADDFSWKSKSLNGATWLHSKTNLRIEKRRSGFEYKSARDQWGTEPAFRIIYIKGIIKHWQGPFVEKDHYPLKMPLATASFMHYITQLKKCDMDLSMAWTAPKSELKNSERLIGEQLISSVPKSSIMEITETLLQQVIHGADVDMRKNDNF